MAAPKAQTGWWFNVREKDPQSAGKENAPAKATSQCDTCGEASLEKPEKSGVGAKFRRQHGIDPYVLDFYCPEHKLAIEIQGGIHDDVLISDYDSERQSWLESQGIRVLCFKNRELLELTDYVVGVIQAADLEPPPRLRLRRSHPS